MKKLAFLSIFAIMSMILLSTVSFPVFAHPPEGTIGLIKFTGYIAISQVPEIIRWRIVVDGTIWINETPHEGQYTVVRMLNGDILHGPSTVFRWKMKKSYLRMVFHDPHSTLGVYWTAVSPIVTGSFLQTFDGDEISIPDALFTREADVRTVQVASRESITRMRIIRRTGLGYIVNAHSVMGTITLNLDD